MATRTTPTPRRPVADPGHQLPAAATEPGDGTGLARVTALIRSLANDLQTLVHQELELVKLEAGQTARRVVRDGAWIGAGVAITAVGGLVLVVALALGLGVLLGSYWLGTLITGLVLVLIGAGVAFKGAKDLRTAQLAPKQTVDSLKEDAEWARRAAQELKNELKRSG